VLHRKARPAPLALALPLAIVTGMTPSIDMPRRMGVWFAGLNVRRVVIALGAATVVAGLLNPIYITPFLELWSRAVILALLLLLAYTVAGNWKQQLMPTWVAQVLAVTVVAPVVTFFISLAAVGGDFAAFLSNPARLLGFGWIAGTGLIIGLMLALLSTVREREAQARAQALQFQLERTTLERQALDAQLRLLHAQIEPHFLFNTLANVQVLVESGSPQAPRVLRSLIAYLRGAMPRLREDRTTLGDEAALVRAYLELMQLRMPDRMEYAVDVPEDLALQRFPAMAMLTLVENAVHHGIDPSEQGGRIDVGARREGDEVLVWVQDTGVGLGGAAPVVTAPTARGAEGTGLANLCQRLQAYYNPPASLLLRAANGTKGVRAEIRFKVSE